MPYSKSDSNSNLVPGSAYCLTGDSTPLVFVTDLRKITSDNIPAVALELPLVFLVNARPTAYPAETNLVEWSMPPVPVKDVTKSFLKQMKRVKKIEPDSDTVPVLQEIVDLINGLLEDDA